MKDFEAGKKCCPICNKEINARAMESWKEYELYMCPNCFVTYSEPMRAASSQWYEAKYRETEFRPSLYADRKHTWECSEFFRNAPVKEGRLLDIGCGEGYFMELTEARGYESVGIDINEQAVKTGKGRGLNVYCMTLDAFSSQPLKTNFDIVCFFHLIEHLENPYGFMKNVNGLLKDKGYIVFSVPNPERLGLVFGRETWDCPPHHLTSWNRRSLEVLLKANGFEVVSIKDEPLKFMEALPAGLSGKVSFSINSKIEEVHTQSNNNTVKKILESVYRSLAKGKKYFSYCAALFFLPWYFLRYRDKKGGSLLVIARKLDVLN